MRLGDRVELFNVYNSLKLTVHYEDWAMISIVENNMTTVMPYMSPMDPLERALLRDEEESEDKLVRN